jgi:hypothetical protein
VLQQACPLHQVLIKNQRQALRQQWFAGMRGVNQGLLHVIELISEEESHLLNYDEGQALSLFLGRRLYENIRQPIA